MDILHALIIPGAILGGLGLFFGLSLAMAGKKFEIEVDPKQDETRVLLPGANCGGCGYAGCDAFAAALVQGKGKVADCNVMSHARQEEVAQLLGLKVEDVEQRVAFVLCAGGHDKATDRFIYQGLQECTAAQQIGGGNKTCTFGCLGLGTCVRACAFDALFINGHGVAVVDPQKCSGCTVCVRVCPRKCIDMVPVKQPTIVACISKDKGPVVKKACTIGCIACGICQKLCRWDAIHVVDNVAQINYDKCTNCGDCVAKCPTKTIVVAPIKP